MATVKSYEWRDGFQSRGVAPEAAARAFDEINKAGRLTADTIVTNARKKTHPLHPLFEWNNTAAAQAYRQHQATRALKAVVVIYERPEGGTLKPTSYFVSYVSPAEAKRGAIARRDYIRAEDAREIPAIRTEVLDRARSELLAWKRKYEALAEFMEIRDVIERVQRQTAVAATENTAHS
jgi:hypothetical protein